MAENEILSDDYVAGLLAKDAKDSAIRYSALGLEAFAPSKPPANKPKPNTRFLRNIIKDTDSHNAALRAKETAESRARLRSLAGTEHREVRSIRVGPGDIRKRQLGDIAAILGGGGRPAKRKRAEVEKENVSRRVNSQAEEPKHESKPKSEEKSDKKADAPLYRVRQNDSKRHRSASPERGKERKDHKRRHRSRSRSPREHKDKESRHRHRSRIRNRSNSPEEGRSSEKSHKPHRHRRSPSPRAKESKSQKSTPIKEAGLKQKPDYDSDPLDDIIGPLPPTVPEVRTRGRGARSQVSGIDSRFSATYDPTTDVQLDPDEENDWDQALEALRDRQKWKQQGADRLRAAGFTDNEIRKWEKGGEKREEDVKWAKKGESREWDRGKVVGDDGVVSIDPQFGRLNDH